jgi:hypothetical protein
MSRRPSDIEPENLSVNSSDEIFDNSITVPDICSLSKRLVKCPDPGPTYKNFFPLNFLICLLKNMDCRIEPGAKTTTG